MFQSAPVLWLQHFATEPVTAALVFVSAVGHTRFYVPAALVIAFGIQFEAGLALLQMVIWNEIVTNVLKVAIGFPRPAEVDASVQLLGEPGSNPSPLRTDAPGFWALPDRTAVTYYRALGAASYGFPSGHVSAATTFWGGASVLLRSRLLAIVGACGIVTTAISRLYLGRHYLADIAGGLVVGAAVVLAGTGRRPWTTDPRRSSLRPIAMWRRAGAIPRAMLVLLLLLVGVPGFLVSPLAVGRLVGVSLVVLALMRRGFPEDDGSLLQRAGRAAVALAIYTAATGAMVLMVRWAGFGATHAGEFLIGAAPAPVYVFGSIAVARRLRLYGSARRWEWAATARW